MSLHRVDEGLKTHHGTHQTKMALVETWYGVNSFGPTNRNPACRHLSSFAAEVRRINAWPDQGATRRFSRARALALLNNAEIVSSCCHACFEKASAIRA